MKIALCQTEIIWEDKNQNLKKAEKSMREAKKLGAGFIFFPEMSFTGFSMNTDKTAENDESTIQAVQRMVQEQGISAGFGWTEKTQEKARNHYTVIDGKGSILSDYVKLHPFSFSGENLHFEAGNKLSSFIEGNLRIGILVCYDLRFPEPFQVLAENCDLIVVAANWPASRREHWKCLLQARAIESQVYLAGVNCCGMQKNLSYAGDSCIFAPDGTRLTDFLQGEGIIVTEIPDDVQNFRRSFPVRRDRRWKLYHEWYGTQP